MSHFFDGENVYSEFAAWRQLHKRFPKPRSRQGNFENGVFFVQFDVVVHVFNVQFHCHFFRNVQVGVDYFVCAVAQEELSLNVRCGFCNDVLCPAFLQKGSYFQRGLEVVADCHNAHVKSGNIHFCQVVDVHAVGNEGVGVDGGKTVDDVFVFVHNHQLVAHFQQFFADCLTEFSHSDKQNRFHISSFSADKDSVVQRFPYVGNRAVFAEGKRQREYSHPACVHQQNKNKFGY